MAAPAPNAPANTGPGATALANIDDWLLGAMNVVFLAKFTVREVGVGSATLYGAVGEKRNPNTPGAYPRLKLPSVSISMVNQSFGRRVEPGERVSYEQFRADQLEYGRFEMINVDGELDAWESDYSWANAEMLLQVGLDTDLLASFKTIMAMMVVAEPTWTLRGNLVFQVKGAAGINLNAPVQTATFAGTGGLEGGADLEGKTKPYLFGAVDNLRPALVDAANLKYLIDPDGVTSIGTVYEAGVSAATTTKDTANGWFTLTAAPNEVVTCDAVGKDRRSTGASKGEVWNLIDEVVQDFAGESAISRAGMAYDGGLYLESGGSRTYEDVLTTLARPSGIYYPAQDNANLHLGEIFGGTPTPVLTYTDAEIVNIRRLETAPPVHSFRVGYKELGYLNPKLLSGVSASERARLSEPRRFGGNGDDATVLTDYANAIAVESFSALYDLADSQSTEAALLALLDEKRNIYEIELARKPMQAWILELVTIDIDAYDFSGGKDVMVVGWTVDLEAKRFTMQAFG